MTYVDNLLIGVKVRLQKMGEGIEEFCRSERGVSNIVATVIMILVVTLLIALFWSKLKAWFTELWTKITGNVDKIT